MEKNQSKRFRYIILISIICLIIIVVSLVLITLKLLKGNIIENNIQNEINENLIKEEYYDEEEIIEDESEIPYSDNLEDDYEEKVLDSKFIQYYQGDYVDIPWCSGNVADCGSSVTSIAMVFTNLLQKEITPKSAATWCKSTDYYVKNEGMSLAYINAVTSYFNRAIGSNVTCKETVDIEEVYSEMKKGALCISLQVEGQFTASNHFIVLSRNI